MESTRMSEHLRWPVSKGKLQDATHSASVRNAPCSDEVTIWLRVDEGRILAAKHVARGCMLCKASASILCEELTGTDLTEARLISKSDMMGWLEFDVTPARQRCVLLALEAFHASLTRLQSAPAATLDDHGTDSAFRKSEEVDG